MKTTDAEWSLPALPLPSNLPPTMSIELQRELAELEPRSPRRPRRQFAALMIANAIYCAVCVVILRLRADWAELPVTWRIGAVVMWTMGLAVPLWFALVPVPGAVVGRAKLAAICGAIFAILAIGIGLFVHPSGPSSFSFADEPLRGHTCLELGAAVSLVPALLVLIVVRYAYPHQTAAVGAAIGAASGAIGGVTLHFYCRVTDATHVSLFHGGVVFVVAIICSVWGGNALRRPWQRKA